MADEGIVTVTPPGRSITVTSFYPRMRRAGAWVAAGVGATAGAILRRRGMILTARGVSAVALGAMRRIIRLSAATSDGVGAVVTRIRRRRNLALLGTAGGATVWLSFMRRRRVANLVAAGVSAVAMTGKLLCKRRLTALPIAGAGAVSGMVRIQGDIIDSAAVAITDSAGNIVTGAY